MAETVRTTWTTVKTETIPAREKVTTSERITVRSIHADRLDVSCLRDLLKAIDAADVPNNAKVEFRKSDVGHLVQLIVEHEQEIAQPAPDTTDGGEQQ